MKIILSVTNDLVTDQRVNKVASFLVKKGNHVTLTGRLLKNSPACKGSEYRMIRFKMLFSKGPLFYACYNIRLFFYLIIHNFDIIIANDLDTLPACFFVAKIKNKILVYDSHEYFTEVPELIDRPMIKKIWENIEKWMLPRIRYAYTVSHAIAESYKKKYGVDMEVIHNFPLYKKERKNYNITLPEGQVVIYQGVLNKGRGLEKLIEAMQYLSQAKLVIIGEGDISKSLKQYVEALKLTEKVIFYGRIPWERLFSYTVKASVGVSLEENMGLNYCYALPNKLFDYIHAGIPVLVSALPEMEKVVKKYEVGMAISDREPKFIANTLHYMLTNYKKRAYWQKNLKFAAKELSWEKEEIKLEKIFSNIRNINDNKH